MVNRGTNELRPQYNNILARRSPIPNDPGEGSSGTAGPTDDGDVSDAESEIGEAVDEGEGVSGTADIVGDVLDALIEGVTALKP